MKATRDITAKWTFLLILMWLFMPSDALALVKKDCGIATGRSTVSRGTVSQFIWPATGRLLIRGAMSDGIYLVLPSGTPLRAIGAGVVAYVGRYFRGFGTVILVRHNHGFVSAYGNISGSTVRRGYHVARGQIIAFAGKPTDAQVPWFYFALRKASKVVDPRAYLACRSL